MEYPKEPMRIDDLVHKILKLCEERTGIRVRIASMKVYDGAVDLSLRLTFDDIRYGLNVGFSHVDYAREPVDRDVVYHQFCVPGAESPDVLQAKHDAWVERIVAQLSHYLVRELDKVRAGC
jgi:hypothetical protein